MADMPDVPAATLPHRTALLPIILLLLVCLLAFGLRLYDLDGQSMWSDEGLSYYRAQQSMSELLGNTITVDGVRTVDTNPPFYFLLLHGWRALLGDSIFILRLMGVSAAFLAIPVMFVLGRALFGPRAGMLAALFLAISPFHVWQTQVLRNYGLLITLNLLCLYGLVRWMQAPARASRRFPWAGLWLGAGLLGIYTHYFGFFIFAFTMGAYVLATLWTKRARGLGGRQTWLGLVLTLLILLPALAAAFARFRAGRQFDFFVVNPLGVVVQAISVFSVGMSPTLTHPWLWLVPGLLLVAGSVALQWRWRRTSVLVLLGYQVVPLGMLLALSTINPLFNGTRHLLIGLPPFLLLAAGLPAGLWRRRHGWDSLSRAGLLLAVVFISVQVVWLQRQFHHPDFIRDDIRAAADYLSTMAAADDHIVLHDTLIKFTFDAYYEGSAPVTAVPLFGRQSEDEAIGQLEEIGAQSQRVWFLSHPQPRTGFPRDLLSQWTDENWHRLNTINFDWLWLPVQLRAYLTQPEIGELPPAATAQQATYENGLTMHGYRMPETLQSGAPFTVQFYLSREGPANLDDLQANYEISLRFQDEQGRVWRQIDQSLWPAYPIRKWPQSKLLRYDHVTQLPAGLPPGSYQVWMRLVARQQERILSLAEGGVDVRLSDVMVAAASCEKVGRPWPNYEQDDILFGRSLLLKGHDRAAASYRPGHLVSLELLWCVLRAPLDEDVRVKVRLTDEENSTLAEAEGALTRADYPPPAWQANQLLQGSIQLPVPSALPAGRYDLQLAVVSGDRGAALPVNVGLGGRMATIEQIDIEEWPKETTFPEIAMPLRANFGEPVLFELHGYELETDTLSPGEQATLTFYWRSAVDAPPINYYAFVHVIQEGQPPAAQADGPPLNGFRPTTSWRAGEVFVDERLLVIPSDAAEGEYKLMVGFYNPDTNERLPAYVSGQRQDGDAVLLQSLSISP